MMIMMMMLTDNPCSVCRGEATTSDARCHCTAPTANVDSSSASSHRTRCVNCGVLATTSSLCARCNALPRCRRCKRHLPRRCFRQFDSLNDDDDDDDDERPHLCRACDRRRGRPTIRKSTGSVVTEINIPLGDAAYNSFDSFVAAHQDQLRQHVEEYRQLHRYVILHGCKSTGTYHVFSNYIVYRWHERSVGRSLARSVHSYESSGLLFTLPWHIYWTISLPPPHHRTHVEISYSHSGGVLWKRCLQCSDRC